MLKSEFVEHYNRISIFQINERDLKTAIWTALEVLYSCGISFDGIDRHSMFVRWAINNPKTVRKYEKEANKLGYQGMHKKYYDYKFVPR